MAKNIALFLLQIGSLIVSVGMWMVLAMIYCRIKYKTLHGFWKNIGVYRPKENTVGKNILIAIAAYCFTIAVYIILKIVNGGMTTELLTKEREVMSVPMLLVCILIVGMRSGFGEEVFFRGVVAKHLMEKMKFPAANGLQALIFMIPHIITFYKAPGLESVLLFANAFVFGLASGIMTKCSESIIPSIP